MLVSKDIKYVGVNDYDIDLFEGQYAVPDGMAYNSYVIIDFKIAVMDTVDARFTDVWLDKLEKVLGDRGPDYLVVSHMEPDHSGSVVRFMQRYQNAKIVANKQAFAMLQRFFGCQFLDRQVVVSDGDVLEIGSHVLNFVFAPMVHWPEVTVTYESTEKVLFSADAFGKFGAVTGEENPSDWACEARRYYAGIVAKYGVPVKNLLQKAEKLDIKTVCPLHGPVLSGDLSGYFSLYKKWANYEAEDSGVTICYASVYGNTEKAVNLLKENLERRGETVSVFDLARCDMAEAIEDAFRYDRLVLASPTYCNGVFPFVSDFLTRIVERDYKNRTVAFIENGSWAPNAAKVMKTALQNCKNLVYAQTEVKILSALSMESTNALEKLGDELISLKNADNGLIG